jgi:hypothetical protein
VTLDELPWEVEEAMSGAKTTAQVGAKESRKRATEMEGKMINSVIP